MKDNVPHEETLVDLIETAIWENPHITRAKIAVKAGVSVKTIRLYTPEVIRPLSRMIILPDGKFLAPS